jgi:dTDP-3-amino-3,4,6-trideoxy-alpha-D-glucose transaminase
MAEKQTRGLSCPPMVLLNDFIRQWSEIRHAVAEAVEAVGSSGTYVLGPSVAAFEAELAQRCGTRHAVGVGNGLDALTIGLRAAGCMPGHKVLTTPLSAFATTLAIMQVGAIPCFVDVDDTGLMDLEQTEAILTHDSSIDFLLPVHLYGRALDLCRLRDFADRFGVRIIEDCAQAIGAKHGDVLAGTIGIAAALSFYPTKNLGCIGDGGALLTNDAGLAESARALRNYGQSSRYVHDHFGLNSRLDELQARILSTALLPRLDAWNKRREHVASAYCRGIANSALVTPTLTSRGPVWHLFPVLVNRGERASFQAHLQNLGVNTGVHYPMLITEQAALLAYKNFEVMAPLARAQVFAKREVSLPIHPYLTDSEIGTVVDACNTWKSS